MIRGLIQVCILLVVFLPLYSYSQYTPVNTDFSKNLIEQKQLKIDDTELNSKAGDLKGKLHYNVVVSRSETRVDFLRMDLREPSGLTPVLLDSAFEGTAMEGLGVYFINAEHKYGVNALFVASIAVHESGWGTSSFARNRNNLTGYRAYTNNPNKAHVFKSKESNIMETARMLSEAYLTQGGAFYSGGYTLTHVYKRYAAPQAKWEDRWDVKVANMMRTLERRIKTRNSGGE
jgi:beta-N-acetylglucosaminidase